VSGIRKTPLTGDSVFLGKTNLAGDGQADLMAHGGPDKAVYAYGAGHWPAWKAEHGLAACPASFGENLTVAGPLEDEIRIGDVFAWGDARLAVSQPRQPCYKLSMLLGRIDIGAAMVRSGRCGFYLRVLAGGTVPLKAARLDRVATRAEAPSVRAMFEALFDPHRPADALESLAATPDLADAWRHGLLTRAAVRRHI
jgi:MOSC domain-containing protein YiiM